MNLEELFKEYPNKNISFALIENNKDDINKIYLKLKINNKIISKSLNLRENNLEKIISLIKDEIINLVKSQNLIDIRTPSFLNAKLKTDKKNNLILIKTELKKIILIENIFVMELSKDYVDIKIKYLGKLENLLNQLKVKNINLKLLNDEWFIETL